MSHCPICAKDSDPKYRPFCSKRCADVDLGKWLTGSYRIPVEPSEDDEELTRALAAESAVKNPKEPLDSDD
ncbi:MAG: DNA gyrase inhibitor YacG [Deltaproteobacteria bacterium]